MVTTGGPEAGEGCGSQRRITSWGWRVGARVSWRELSCWSVCGHKAAHLSVLLDTLNTH